MGAISKSRRKAQAAKVKSRFKKRESEGRSGLTGGKKGETISQYRARQKSNVQRAAENRHKKYMQTKVQAINRHTKKRYTNAEKARIIAAGYTVEGYADAVYSEDGGRAEREAATRRQKQLDTNLSKFDAKSYLNRYADLKAAFGTDEGAARQHYIRHGFAENRDISPFKAPTTVPSGSFGISPIGKQVAEQQKKTYEQNRLKAGAKFADDRVEKQVAAAKDAAEKVSKVVQGVQKVGKFIGNNPKDALSIANAARKDISQLNTRYNQDIRGRAESERDKTALYKAPQESTLKEDIRDVNAAVQIGKDVMNAEGRDAKFKAIAKADPQSIVNIAQKGAEGFMASNLVQTAGEMAGLPSNFKMQIQQPVERIKDELSKVTIGDRDSTYKVISDFARDVGTDPDYKLIARGLHQFRPVAKNEDGSIDAASGGNPHATFMDKVRMSFDVSQPTAPSLNKEQMGIMGSLGNRIISGMATDIVREGYEGSTHTDIQKGVGFDALSLTKVGQNILGNFTDPDSVASKQGANIKKTANIGGGGPTIPSLIEGATGLSLPSGGTPLTPATTNDNLTIEGGETVDVEAESDEETESEETPLPSIVKTPDDQKEGIVDTGNNGSTGPTGPTGPTEPAEPTEPLVGIKPPSKTFTFIFFKLWTIYSADV